MGNGKGSQIRGPITHKFFIIIFSAAIVALGTDEIHKRYLNGEFKVNALNQAKEILQGMRDDQSFIGEGRARADLDKLPD